MLKFFITLFFLALTHSSWAATFNVTNTNDVGAGSLRDAITQANSTPGPDIINFTIAGTLILSSPLPNINEELHIDGTTAPGYVVGSPSFAISFPGNNAIISATNVSNLNITGLNLSQQSAVREGTGILLVNCINPMVSVCIINYRNTSVSISGGTNPTVQNNDFSNSGTNNNSPALNLANVTNLATGAITGNTWGGTSSETFIKMNTVTAATSPLLINDGNSGSPHIVIPDGRSLTAAGNTNYLLFIQNSADITIDNVEFQRSTSARAANGLLAQNTDNIIVQNCNFSLLSLGANIQSNTSNPTVQNNDFSNSGTNNNSPALNLANVTNLATGAITGNTWGGTSSETFIKMNTVTAATSPLLINDGNSGSPHIVIPDGRSLTAAGNTNYLLFIENSADVTVDNVEFQRSTSARAANGLLAQNTDNIIVQNCNFSLLSLGANIQSNTSNPTVQNNDFSNSGTNNNSPALNLANVTNLATGAITSNTWGGTSSETFIKMNTVTAATSPLLINDGNSGSPHIVIPDGRSLTAAGNTNYLLYIQNSADITIDNVEFQRSTSARAANGLLAQNTDNIIVQNCNFSLLSLGANIQSNTSNPTVQNNDFSNSGTNNNSPALNLTNVTNLATGAITSNTWGGTSSETFIKMNTVTAATSPLLINDGNSGSPHIVIPDGRSLTAAGNTNYLLYIQNSADVTIDNVEFQRSTSARAANGLLAQNTDNIIVQNCNFSLLSLGANIQSNTSNPTVQNNDFSNSGTNNNSPALNLTNVTNLATGAITSNTWGGTSSETFIKMNTVTAATPPLLINDGNSGAPHIVIPDGRSLTAGNDYLLHIQNSADITIDNVEFQRSNGCSATRVGSGIQTSDCNNLTIQNSIFKNLTNSFNSARDANIVFQCNLFRNNNIGLVTNNTSNAISLTDNVLEQNTTAIQAGAPITATGNYWGAPDGSSTDGGSGDSYTGSVSAGSFLTTVPTSCGTSISFSDFDVNRGTALIFDGIDDVVDMGNPTDLDITANITLEGWINLNGSAGDQKIITKFGDITGNDAYSLQVVNGFPELALKIAGTWVTVNAGMAAIPGRWYHIAGTYDGTSIKIYINGIEMNSINQTGAIDVSSATFKLGAWATGNYLDGQMDEIRVWNTARTATQIRENLHLTLDPCSAGLVTYYQLNDGVGSTTVSSSNGNASGTLDTNMDPNTAWTASTVNVGNDLPLVSNSQTRTNVASGSSIQNFNTANLSLQFFQHSTAEDFTVTYQAFTPENINGAIGVNIIQNPIWTVNKSESAFTSSMLADYTFTLPTPFASTDPSKYKLYWRPMYSDGAWTNIATASNMTANTVTFGKISETGQFMIVQASDANVSDVRGNMYNFDGNNDYINLGAALLPTIGVQSFSISTWIKTTDNDAGIVTQYQFSGSTRANRFGLRTTNGQLTYWRGGAVRVTSAAANINDGNWHHVAMTRTNTGNIRLYIDGILNGTGTDALPIQNVNTVIGNFGTTTSVPLNGSLDEVRIWNVARTQAEIRENLHLTLKGNETGLVAYYQFNNDDPVGTTNGVKDASGNGNDGTTTNMTTADYIASEVAVAGGTSDRITIGAGGIYTFPNTGTQIEFGATTPNGELVISRLETEKPTGWQSIGTDVDDEYFVINNYGTNQTFSTLQDLTINRMGYVAPAAAAAPCTNLGIYKRASNAFGATWGTQLGCADAATAGTAGSTSYDASAGITTFSQIVVANAGNNSNLPIELLEFTAKRKEADLVQLDWSTAAELNNKGFYVERLLATESEFTTIEFVEGKGTSTDLNYYQLLDNNSYTGNTYYRLRQVDFDGSVTYSDTRVVAGRTVENSSNNTMSTAIYPNPTNNLIHIRFDQLPANVETATIRILDTQGRLVYQQEQMINAHETITLQAFDQLPSALYLVSIQLDNGDKSIHKIIKK